jgi:hypothetical protein
VTSDEYRAAIEAIGVNIDQSGRMLGISRRHAHRFATGESPVPPIVERFLEVMQRFEIGYEWHRRPEHFVRREHLWPRLMQAPGLPADAQPGA